MQDKVALLMEETGCDRGEAELALAMCGYEVEKAVKAIPRLLRNIAVLKGKFQLPDSNQFGLILVALNVKSRALLRARAVLSYNPAVYAVSLGKDWFEFEKHLFGCRLREGSLQAESQEIEQGLASHYRAHPASAAFATAAAEPEAVSGEIEGVLKALFRDAQVSVSVRKDILDLGQFQSPQGSEPEPAAAASSPRGARGDEPLILKVGLAEDEAGVEAGELRAGDVVFARVIDGRDIAQYLSKILGGSSEQGPLPIAVPVEAIESPAASAGDDAPAGRLVRVRLAAGVCGDAHIPAGKRFKVSRSQGAAAVPWWRRLFGA